MNKQPSFASSVALRVATAMYQMGIDGLPRNYELVYEAYSGANPELARDFVALGKTKSQKDLDDLGRRYLPHHHEETAVSRTNDRVRLQITNVMDLLKQEKSALSDYSKLIGEASRTIGSNGTVDPDLLSRSIRELSAATRRKASDNEAMAAEVETHTAELESVRQEIDHLQRLKFVDPVTGLANRRAFNKAVARIYANPDLPMMCGLAFAEIDDFDRLCEAGGPGAADHILRQVGEALKTAGPPGDLVVRLDGHCFAFLLNSGDETEIMRLVDALRQAVGSRPVVHAKTNQNLGCPALSAGVAMSVIADGPRQLMAYAEKALAASHANGGNRATLFSRTAEAGAGGNWMIYRP
ncbi:GGDEF domain-containing protein [uncultured Hoeflea sp.]|uniref:GGDEF domain-containing protein n=1 Tax=uncultured Hoeflea sp. TaxID=538666 RepID=UPI0026024AB6|nr:GGDEF domain-containing protein [uncultured Hoeflea sp.]